MGEQKFKCCICGQMVKGWGNNPYPLSTDPNDSCCDDCNMLYVVPARIHREYVRGLDEGE